MLASPLLSLKIIYSRSLKSAQSTSDLIPASHAPVELYSEDSGPGRTFDDVLARPDIVGVIIALPIALQPRFIEAALKAGKHVLAEKPVGPDVESAKKLISMYREISAEKHVFWSVAEQFRFLPKFVWGAEQAKKLGKVIGFHFRVFQLFAQGKSSFVFNALKKNKEERFPPPPPSTPLFSRFEDGYRGAKLHTMARGTDP